MLKTQGDFIGRTLAQRPALQAAERLQLVGVRPANRARACATASSWWPPRPRARASATSPPRTPSVELEGWVGLALLAGGARASARA